MRDRHLTMEVHLHGLSMVVLNRGNLVSEQATYPHRPDARRIVCDFCRHTSSVAERTREYQGSNDIVLSTDEFS